MLAARDRTYEVRIAEPLLNAANTALLEGGLAGGRRFVVVDDGVPKARRDDLGAYFDAGDVTVGLLVVEGGERFKTIENVISVVEAMAAFGVDRRNEPVVAVGGGAVLDTVGVAASLYRRGVPLVRVPTTLLAYVDAAVGIKTAVNLGARKNLLGTFYTPKLVLLDRCFLRDLPAAEVASGLGEILKLGLGCDRAIFEMLEEGANAFDATRFADGVGLDLLTRSIATMLREIGPNLFEDDLSRTVDLGHTFSQAFELAEVGEPMRHGEAVAIDLNLSAILSWRRGLLDRGAVARVATLTKRLGLPTMVPEIPVSAIWRSVIERTRHRAGRQRIPLPIELGKCVFVDDVRLEELDEALKVLRQDHWR